MQSCFLQHHFEQMIDLEVRITEGAFVADPSDGDDGESGVSRRNLGTDIRSILCTQPYREFLCGQRKSQFRGRALRTTRCAACRAGNARRRGVASIRGAGFAAWTDGRSTTSRAREMNWDPIEETWAQLAGSIKKRWRKLGDETLDAAAGACDEPASAMRETSGIAEDQAGEQIDHAERHRKH